MTDFRTIPNPALLPVVRSPVLMNEIRGMPCALRVASFVPGRRCSGIETVVGCHLPGFGKGVSYKNTDLAVCAGCAACHDILDGRDGEAADYIMRHYPSAFQEQINRALQETHARLVGLGVIIVKGNTNGYLA